MPLFAESKERNFSQIMNDMVNATNVTRASPGSKMRALVESTSRKMGRMYQVFDLNFVQAFLDGAEGRFLDFFGEMLGVSRLGEQEAAVTALDRNVRLYVEVGNFGDINGGASINIPSGVIISTALGGGGVRYRTVVSTILDKDTDEGYVSVQAVRTGAAQNVGKNQLTFHDFTAYTDSVNSSLKVTNEADIITGGDLETDANYRFRISNAVVSAQGGNETSIRLAALAIPGVANTVAVSDWGRFGPG